MWFGLDRLFGGKKTREKLFGEDFHASSEESRKEFWAPAIITAGIMRDLSAEQVEHAEAAHIDLEKLKKLLGDQEREMKKAGMSEENITIALREEVGRYIPEIPAPRGEELANGEHKEKVRETPPPEVAREEFLDRKYAGRASELAEEGLAEEKSEARPDSETPPGLAFSVDTLMETVDSQKLLEAQKKGLDVSKLREMLAQKANELRPLVKDEAVFREIMEDERDRLLEA